MFSSNTSQVSGAANYIEDVFSTWLYTGNSSTQTITNGIDLSTYGGLVWIKDRSQGTGYHHILQDTARGASWCLFSNLTNAQSQDSAGTNFAFNNNGFFIGSSNVKINGSDNYASWTFRKQPKFFDVVTYTGNGANGRAISHSLGASPGFVIIKRTDSTGSWWCWHSSFSAATDYIRLNTTETVNALGTLTDLYQGVSSTTVTVGTNSAVNGNGMSYVMYVFASNAGGFGLTGTDNVISCGSFTGNGSTSGPSITLGYEPQWILTKNATSSGWNWNMFDNMRGLPVGSGDLALQANLSNAESGALNWIDPTATGFNITSSNAQINESGSTILYIAIRRGPMKTPTSGTSVFSPITANSPTGTKLTTNFPVDLSITQERTSAGGAYWMDRLRGALSPGQTGNTPYLQSSSTSQETSTTITNGWDNTGLNVAYFGGTSAVWWNLRRAPSFFDEVCYSGTGTNQNVTHNLGVAPELMIHKTRNVSSNWTVYVAGQTYTGVMNTDWAFTSNATVTSFFGGTPTSTYFRTDAGNSSISGENYVMYLFASCPGVSKVGSYSGTGATQTISCGFAARFVFIKRTDSTGSWFVWDTARGMVAGTDPRLPWNSAAAETNTNWVYTDASGFQIVTTDATVNASGGSYIYLAIA